MRKILSILLLLFIGNVVYSQSVCEKAIRQARSDFKKSRYFFHSEELLPVENTYLYVLREYYKINWRFIDPSKYYDCYDSTMNVMLKRKYGNNYLDRAHAITDSLEKLPNWRRDVFYPGGVTELNKYLNEKLETISIGNTKYNGTAYVQVEINDLGKVVKVKIFRGFSRDLDEKIIKVIKEMPLWEPAYLYGKPTRQMWTFPLKINGDKITPANK
jgi:hypothetical protein